jgi:Ca2+/Na+ antiporter
MSIFWIWFISEILVDVLKLFGVLLNVPESFLAMTLLAFGNSAPGKIINMKTTLFKNKTLYLRYPNIYFLKYKFLYS